MEQNINSVAQKIRKEKDLTPEIWMKNLKDVFFNSPLASNVFFGLIISLLEKLVELEFACPCDPYYNAIFASAFFIVPATLSFILTKAIYISKSENNMLQCCTPPMMWLILTFLDGQYFACAMTYWSGSYETVPQTTHQKWCEPDNASGKSEEFLKKTAQWFTLSQVIGIALIILASLVQIMYPVVFKQKSKDQGTQYEQPGAPVDPQVLGQSGNTNTQGSEDHPV